MVKLRKAGSIELSDDFKFTQSSWKFERAGWIGLGAFVLAAVFGLIGPGIFSQTSRQDKSGELRVVFDRFVHYRTEGAVTVRLKAPSDAGKVQVWIDDAYLSGVKIQTIQPEPLDVVIGAGRTAYTFTTLPGERVREVVFRVVYEKVGSISGGMGAGPDLGVEISQFVFP